MKLTIKHKGTEVVIEGIDVHVSDIKAIIEKAAAEIKKLQKGEL